MVIGQLCIVKHARRHLYTVFKRFLTDRFKASIVAAKRRFHLANHIPREIPAVGSGIGDQLMRFIQLLRGSQRLFCRKAELRIGFALQGRQVIKKRRALNLMLACRFRHNAFGAAHARGNGFRQLLLIDALFPLWGDIHALIIAEVCADGIICLRHKGVDFFPAPDKHRQRRRLHAPNGQKHVIAERIGARSVHADEPICICAAARAGIERIVIRRRAQGFKPSADGLVGHRRNP